MRYSHRFFLYAPVAFLLLLAIAVMVWWKTSATAFDDRLTAANGRIIMPGVRISYASKTIGGFPFRLDSVMDGFTVEVQMRTGPLVWRSEHLAIHALTYGRNEQIYEAAGAQTLSWTDSDGAAHRELFLPGTLRASAILGGGRLSRFDLDAVALTSRDFAAGRLQFHLRHAPDRDALQFALSGDNVRMTVDGHPGAAQQIEIEGALAPAVPLAALLAGGADWRSAADSWRLDGGRLQIERIEAVQGALATHGAGQFSLDEGHLLQGRLALSAEAQPHLIYIFKGERIYSNAISQGVAVAPPFAGGRSDVSGASPQQSADLIKNIEAVLGSHTVELHPLY
jgi:hypothetical protein